MSTTSIGPQPDQGGNESHGNADGMGNKTLGEQGTQEPPAGAGGDAEAATSREPKTSPKPDPSDTRVPGR